MRFWKHERFGFYHGVFFLLCIYIFNMLVITVRADFVVTKNGFRSAVKLTRAFLFIVCYYVFIFQYEVPA